MSPGHPASRHSVFALRRVGFGKHCSLGLLAISAPNPPPPPQSPEQGHFLVSERSFWEPSDSGVEGASPRQDCREMPCQGLWACECVTVGEGSRVNSHCPVLSAAVARYTGLFGQLPCLSVCLGDVG